MMLKKKNGHFKTIFIIAAMWALILGKGLLAFYVIGDIGVPPWGFGTVKDVPGESPYALYDVLPHPQHIRGAGGK